MSTSTSTSTSDTLKSLYIIPNLVSLFNKTRGYTGTVADWVNLFIETYPEAHSQYVSKCTAFDKTNAVRKAIYGLFSVSDARKSFNKKYLHPLGCHLYSKDINEKVKQFWCNPLENNELNDLEESVHVPPAASVTVPVSNKRKASASDHLDVLHNKWIAEEKELNELEQALAKKRQKVSEMQTQLEKDNRNLLIERIKQNVINILDYVNVISELVNEPRTSYKTLIEFDKWASIATPESQ